MNINAMPNSQGSSISPSWEKGLKHWIHKICFIFIYKRISFTFSNSVHLAKASIILSNLSHFTLNSVVNFLVIELLYYMTFLDFLFYLWRHFIGYWCYLKRPVLSSLFDFFPCGNSTVATHIPFSRPALKFCLHCHLVSWKIECENYLFKR